MRVLGIESSCDETAVALLEDGKTVLSDRVASQDSIHAPYSGVVPELASRQHLRLLPSLFHAVLEDSGILQKQIGLVAVTRGPGLAGCLLAGVSFAKGLAYGLGLPLLGINHIEAHIFSCCFSGKVDYPALALVVSGGHTILVLLPCPGSYRLLGQTRDDAVGEAYDKVATMLGLPFPGGPAMESRAKMARGEGVLGAPFPRPLIGSGDLDFSFSGLKTAVLYRLKSHAGETLGEEGVNEIARGFQEAVIEVLLSKTLTAAKCHGVRCVLLAGGVARNESLRARLGERVSAAGVRLIVPEKKYCSDNAVMVAALAARKYADGERGDATLDIEPGLRLCS